MFVWKMSLTDCSMCTWVSLGTEKAVVWHHQCARRDSSYQEEIEEQHSVDVSNVYFLLLFWKCFVCVDNLLVGPQGSVQESLCIKMAWSVDLSCTKPSTESLTECQNMFSLNALWKHSSALTKLVFLFLKLTEECLNNDFPSDFTRLSLTAPAGYFNILNEWASLGLDINVVVSVTAVYGCTFRGAVKRFSRNKVVQLTVQDGQSLHP